MRTQRARDRFPEFMAVEPIEIDSWRPPPRPHRHILHGQFVRIEPLEAEKHVGELHESLAADPEHTRWEYRFQRGFSTRAELFAYLVGIETSADAYYGVYIDLTTGKAAGLGSLMSVDQANGSIELGAIMLAPCMSGTAAGTEALILQIRWAFELGYRRVEWTCDPHNAASMRAAQRLGFSYELTMRKRYATKGRNRDKACFAICSHGDEWAAIDRAHRAWLALSNFDANRQQRSALSTLTAPLLRTEMIQEAEPSEHSNARGQPIGAPLRPEWRPPPPPVRQTLTGKLVSCVPLAAEHAIPLGVALEAGLTGSDKALWKFLPYGPFETPHAFIEWIGQQSVSAERVWFAIVVNGPQQREELAAKGLIGVRRTDEQHGCLEIGPCLFGAGRSTNVHTLDSFAATEALLLLLSRAFRSGYRRVEWPMDAEDAASHATARRLGFVLEGTHRQHKVVKTVEAGNWRHPRTWWSSRDTAWFSMLDHEWPVAQTALDRWLGDESAARP